MNKMQRLEIEIEQVRNEARELREAFHSAHRHKESLPRRMNHYVENMAWWQWFLLGFIGGWSWFGFLAAILL